MKNLGKKSLIIVALLVLSVVGVSYAFFDYYKIGKNSKLIAGDIYLDYIDKTESISLTNIYPETAREARSRTDNVINFSVAGGNTSTNTIYYEVRLNEGDPISGKTRFDPKDIKIDLSEVNSDGTETLLFGALSFDEFKDTKIWVDSVKASGSINKNYKLRFWLSRNVLISDTEPDADYTTSEFENSYVSIKVTVYGDFEEKEALYSYVDYEWSGGIVGDHSDYIKNIKSINFVKMDEDEMITRYNASNIKADFTYRLRNNAGSVLAWLESNEEDSTKYTMYVASKQMMFLTNGYRLFDNYVNLIDVHFENVSLGLCKNMSMMFSRCSNLTNLDVSNFNTSISTDMSNMFDRCSKLNTLDVSNFDTSNVEDMSQMFYGCSSLTNLEVSNFDTSNVEDMSSMFNKCSSLTNLEVSNFDTSNVEDMSSMFWGCSGLTSIDVGNFDTSNVTDMSSMFYGCENLTSLDASNFDTSNVEDMSSMFMNCSNLTSIDVGNFDTSNVTDMSTMFCGCSKLISLDLNNFNIGDVTNMEAMFWGCGTLTTIYANTNWNSENVTTSTNMFLGCRKLVGAISFDSNKTDVTYANPTTGYFTTKETA